MFSRSDLSRTKLPSPSFPSLQLTVTSSTFPAASALIFTVSSLVPAASAFDLSNVILLSLPFSSKEISDPSEALPSPLPETFLPQEQSIAAMINITAAIIIGLRRITISFFFFLSDNLFSFRLLSMFFIIFTCVFTFLNASFAYCFSTWYIHMPYLTHSTAASHGTYNLQIRHSTFFRATSMGIFFIFLYSMIATTM